MTDRPVQLTRASRPQPLRPSPVVNEFGAPAGAPPQPWWAWILCLPRYYTSPLADDDPEPTGRLERWFRSRRRA